MKPARCLGEGASPPENKSDATPYPAIDNAHTHLDPSSCLERALSLRTSWSLSDKFSRATASCCSNASTLDFSLMDHAKKKDEGKSISSSQESGDQPRELTRVGHAVLWV